MHYPELSFKELTGYAAGAAGKNIVYVLVSVFYLLYLYDSCGRNPLLFSSIFLSVRCLDILLTLLLGCLIERVSLKGGKLRPWILLAPVLNAVCLLMLFIRPDCSPTMYAVYAVCTYLAWSICHNLFFIPFWSLVPTFSSNMRQREYTVALACFASVCAGTAALWIFGKAFDPLGPASARGVSPLVLAAAAGFIFICCGALNYFTLTDRTLNNHKRLPVSACFRAVFKNEQLLAVGGLCLFQQLILALIYVSLSLCLFYFHENTQLMKLILLPGAGAQLLGFLTFTTGVKFLSRRGVFILSCLCMLAGCPALFFLTFTNILEFSWIHAAFCVLCFGIAWSQVSFIVMAADSVDYSEFKLRIRSEATVMAAMVVSTKLGRTLALFISLLSLSAGTWLYQTTDTSLYSFMLITLFACILGCICMLVVYVCCYKLHSRLFENVLNQIPQFRSQNLPQQHFNHEQTSPRTRISYALDPDSVIADLQASTKEEVLQCLILKLQTSEALNSVTAFTMALQERLRLAPCGIASGIAIPHASGACVRRSAIAVAQLRTPLDFGSPDGIPCDLVFMLATPDDGYSHLTLLGKLSLILNTPDFPDKLRQATSGQEIVDRLYQCEKLLKL